MRRISTATKVVDKWGPGKPGFTDGNAVTGIPATDLEAQFFDSVQEELCGVVEAAGLTVDGSSMAQLLAAIGIIARKNTVAKIQPIAASVAANALTLTLSSTTLDFRSATGASGAVNSAVQIAAALNVTVPSGATLGTVSGQAAKIALIVAYNGGAPVLCVANTAGGVLNLDETGVISPTTISAGANSAGVIYSASAVAANSPYRVVGFVNVTEASAGIWATAPSLVQGLGGMAVADLLDACSVFGSSLGTSGYQKLPSGLIVQWGVGTASASGPISVSYPIAFPAGVYAIIAQDINSASSSGTARVGSVGAAGFNISMSYYNGSSLTYFADVFTWIAVGK